LLTQDNRVVSNKWAGAGDLCRVTGEFGEHILIQHYEPIAFPIEGTGATQAIESFVGVDQREADSVGKMLLR
jgi:hypothetical protein